MNHNVKKRWRILVSKHGIVRKSRDESEASTLYELKIDMELIMVEYM